MNLKYYHIKNGGLDTVFLDYVYLKKREGVYKKMRGIEVDGICR